MQRALVVGVLGCLGVLGGALGGNRTCPGATKTTIYGTETRECQGHGTCNRETGVCACEDGSVWADWQVDAGNLRASKHADCGGFKAHASAAGLRRHWLYLIVMFALEFAGCWWAFGPVPQRWGLPPPPSLGRLSASPWLLPKYSATAACATLAATVLSALVAGYDCDCFWLHDFDRYETISGLAMHPPMTVVTPAGVIPSALLLIASAWAALKLALASPYYRSGAAKAALGLWCCNAMNSALWGTGVNVFFNESWDHDSHIQLSYFYFAAASLNNTFLFIAILPELTAPPTPGAAATPWYKAASADEGSTRLAFHAAWMSPAMAFGYLFLYQWHGKPGWSLPICEHLMSAFQVIAFAIVLGAFMQRLAGRDESAMGLLPLERRGAGSGAT